MLIRFVSKLATTIFLSGCLAFSAIADTCDLSGSSLFIGEDTDFILCGDEFPAEISITSDDPSLFNVTYL
jgi:hypothetical protein